MDEESEALIATLFGFEHVPGLSVAHPEHVSMSEQPLLRFSSEKKTSRRNIAGRFIDEGGEGASRPGPTSLGAPRAMLLNGIRCH